MWLLWLSKSQRMRRMFRGMYLRQLRRWRRHRLLTRFPIPITIYYNPHRKGLGDPKPERTVKPKKGLSKVRKATGEAELYDQIWKDRPHVSQFSGEKLHEMNVCCFLHVLPKSTYPRFRLEKRNIMLGTFDEHYMQTNIPREKWNPSFRKQWEEIEDKLKSEYFILYGKK